MPQKTWQHAQLYPYEVKLGMLFSHLSSAGFFFPKMCTDLYLTWPAFCDRPHLAEQCTGFTVIHSHTQAWQSEICPEPGAVFKSRLYLFFTPLEMYLQEMLCNLTFAVLANQTERKRVKAGDAYLPKIHFQPDSRADCRNTCTSQTAKQPKE